MGFRSKNVRKYRAFNKEMAKLADCYAEAMYNAIDLRMNGFSDDYLEGILKRIVTRMNSVTAFGRKTKLRVIDRNGSLKIKLLIGKEKVFSCIINNKEDAVKAVIGMVAYCTENADYVAFSSEFSKFLNRYLDVEYMRIINHVQSAPYSSGEKRVTLDDYIKGSIDVDDADVWGGKIIAIS